MTIEQPGPGVVPSDGGGGNGGGAKSGGGGGGGPPLHKRSSDGEFRDVLGKGLANARRNLVTVAIFSVAVNLLVLDGTHYAGIELPTFVTLKVVTAEVAVRGDTANNVQKNVTLETGAVIQVPNFIKEGDILKIDTRTGEYLERAK